MVAQGVTSGDPNKVNKAGDTLTGSLVSPDGSPLASQSYVGVHSGGMPAVTLIDIEKDFGARGDDPAFDGPAIRDATLAAAQSQGAVVFPRRGVTYRVNATDLVKVWDDGQYAAFPLPRVPADAVTAMVPIAFLGPVGSAAVMGRLFNGSGNVLASHGAPVIQVEYDTDFAWDPAHGHPSVFGTPDADFGGGLSAVFAIFRNLIIRQPSNPSLCNINLENAAGCDIDDVYSDTIGFPDESAEPINPTGASILLPRAGNAVNVTVGRVGAWGYYAGPAVSEHSHTARQFAIACKIAVPIRASRGTAHAASMGVLKAEECTYGIAGYDPSGTGPNLGVVDAPGLDLDIALADFEDYDRSGTAAWMYTPTKGAHVYAPGNQLGGGIRAYKRIDSGPGGGAQTEVYTVGGDQFAITNLRGGAATTRLTGHAPSNGVTGQTIFTTQTPTTSGGSGDQVDAGSSYSLGTLFTADADGTSTGARWFFPTTLPSQPVVFELYQWANDIAGTLLASKTFSGTPTPGDWNSVTWDIPVNLTAGQRYVVQVWTADHYVFGAAATLPITNGHLTAPADDTVTPVRNGRLHVGASPVFTDQMASGLCFFVDVIYQEAV